MYQYGYPQGEKEILKWQLASVTMTMSIVTIMFSTAIIMFRKETKKPHPP